MDPDPGGLKTCGSGFGSGSGSPTLHFIQGINQLFRSIIICMVLVFWTWILSSTSKKLKINHDFYCFVTSQ
jgi:hypothetical protein